MGISFHGSPTGEPGRGLIYQGLMCTRWLWRWASLSIGGPLGNLGVHLLETLRQLKEGSEIGVSLSVGVL